MKRSGCQQELVSRKLWDDILDLLFESGYRPKGTLSVGRLAGSTVTIVDTSKSGSDGIMNEINVDLDYTPRQFPPWIGECGMLGFHITNEYYIFDGNYHCASMVWMTPAEYRKLHKKLREALAALAS